MDKQQEVYLALSLTESVIKIVYTFLEEATSEMQRIAAAIEDAGVYLSTDKYVCAPAGQIVCARVYLPQKAKE